MKILLTGSTGFLGSRLVKALAAQGDEVACLLREGANLQKLFSGFDAVIHAATNYGGSSCPMSELLESNVRLPVDLFESANATLFINIDTVLPPAVSPYALSKHQASEWLETLQGPKLINLRLQTMYGPGDRRFLGTLIRDCLDNKPVIPLTPGGQVRDFLHVDDAVSAILNVLNRPRPSGNYDVGTGVAYSIREVAEKVAEFTETISRLDFGGMSYRKHEPMVCRADVSRMAVLGWEAAISFPEGLKATIEQMRQ